jgi:threonine dehydratase
MPALITLTDIHAAATRIAGTAVRTPLIQLDPARLRALGIAPPAAAIYLKDESAQPIGSFKLRGAYNMIASLPPEQLQRGVITYSSGNHAQGVAFAARALGIKAVIVMPDNAPQIKRDATAALVAEIVTVGPASSERKLKAEELAAAHGYTIIPPYDDPAIIAGQATCGLEILEQLSRQDQLPGVDTLILSPVSGGGLLSGIATAIKLAGAAKLTGAASFEGDGLQPVHSDLSKEAGFSPGGTAPYVFGCEPELAADAKQSFDTQQLVEWPAAKTTRTLCDGLRTQSLGELNFAHILQFVDGIITVTEPEIRTATHLILAATDRVAEPSGAITLAAALFHAHELPPAQTIVAVLSGGNIEPTLRAQLESESLTASV